MKINVSTALREFDRSEMRSGATVQGCFALMTEMLMDLGDEARKKWAIRLKEQPVLTLSGAIYTALGTGCDWLTPEEKFKAFQIGAKTPKQGEVELDAEEISLLKKIVGKVFLSPLVVGQTQLLLEGKEVFKTAQVLEADFNAAAKE